MTERCREGIPEPYFEEYSSGLSVTFTFENPIGPRVNTMQESLGDKRALDLNFSKRQREIIQVLEKFDELKASEIREKLSESVPERTLRDDFSELKKANFIGSRGRGKNAVWFIDLK